MSQKSTFLIILSSEDVFSVRCKTRKKRIFSSKDETKLKFDGSAPMNPNAQTFFQEKNGF
jgi:hypothetical protein